MTIEPSMLAYLEPDDLEGREDWARQHMEWHQRIYTEAVKQGFPRYDAFAALRDMENLEDWSYWHSTEHANITHSIFIGEPADLSFLDPEDPDNWASWMDVHAKIHAEIRTALKLV